MGSGHEQWWNLAGADARLTPELESSGFRSWVRPDWGSDERVASVVV